MTMGQGLDAAIKTSLDEDRLLNALFLEVAGWLAIEITTKKFSMHLKSLIDKNEMKLSPRLGPGYSYKIDDRSVMWPLEQQRVLFELFKYNEIGVTLLESCAMLPKISRSGLFGMLPVNK